MSNRNIPWKQVWAVAGTIATIIGSTVTVLMYIQAQNNGVQEPPDNGGDPLPIKRILGIQNKIIEIDATIQKFQKQKERYADIEPISQIEEDRVRTEGKLRRHVDAAKDLDKIYPFFKEAWDQENFAGILQRATENRLPTGTGESYLTLKGAIQDLRREVAELDAKYKRAKKKRDLEKSIRIHERLKRKLKAELDELLAVAK